MSKEVYLGDGLYASFDGYQIKLRAPREIDHEVFIEVGVFKHLLEYAQSIGMLDVIQRRV